MLVVAVGRALVAGGAGALVAGELATAVAEGWVTSGGVVSGSSTMTDTGAGTGGGSAFAGSRLHPSAAPTTTTV